MRCASRREQPVSLRRHYPHQVLGRSSSSSLSAFRLPFGCASFSRTRPTTRSALFCARMGGGFCSDGCGDGRETVMTTARNMGELAGFAIPRLGMGTMALAIEAARTAIRRSARFTPAWTRACAIWIRLGRIICRASLALALRKIWGTAKSWCVMRSLRGMAPEMKCWSPRKPAIDAPWRFPLLLLLCPIRQNRTLRGGIPRLQSSAWRGTPAFAGGGQSIRVDGGFAPRNHDS